MHRVHTVAYSEDGLSLIGSQIGKPIMLNAFTSAMCVDPWGRIGFARALIEVTEKELKEEVIMAVPFEDGTGCTKERIKVEYEWKPPLCLDCHIFGHNASMCPKNVTITPVVVAETSGDGFTTVTRKKKNKGKAQNGGNTKKSNGFKVNNPNANLQYRPVTVQKDNSAKTNEDPSVEDPNSVFKSPNSFDALCDNDDSVKVSDLGETSEGQKLDSAKHFHGKDEEDSDSEVEESYVVYDYNTIVIKGASTPSNDGLDV
ncbi:trichome birefringence-like protein 3 [Tanacetum coccineum]